MYAPPNQGDNLYPVEQDLADSWDSSLDILWALEQPQDLNALPSIHSSDSAHGAACVPAAAPKADITPKQRRMHNRRLAQRRLREQEKVGGSPCVLLHWSVCACCHTTAVCYRSASLK